MGRENAPCPLWRADSEVLENVRIMQARQLKLYVCIDELANLP